MSLTEKEVRAKIQQAVGKSVKFTFPNAKDNQVGHLMERVIVGSRQRIFWNVVDLIDFPKKGKSKLCIRIGYYKQVGDKLHWASRMTITEPVDQMKRIFAEAAEQKKWFRDLLPKT